MRNIPAKKSLDNFLVSLLCLVVIGLAFSVLPAGARAGFITGYVTEGSGGPGIENIYVDVYDPAGNFVNNWGVSDNDGIYTVTDLAPGDYKVVFNALQTPFISRWYNDKADFASADTVTVTDNGVTDLGTAVLDQGGSISGKVVDSNGQGVAGVWVKVYDSADQMIGYSAQATGTDGLYTVPGVVAGTDHRVYFNALHTTHLSGWYHNVDTPDNAQAVTVTGTADTALLDNTLTLGGSISGTVKDSGGNGIVGAWVAVYDSDNNLIGYSEDIGTDGTYAVTGLPGGDHRVLFAGYETNYVSKWYDDKNFNNADTVSVTVSQLTPDINAVLVLGGSISGRVTDGNTVPIEKAYIDVYDLNQIWRGYAETDTNGYYQVTGLPAGSHKMEFFQYYQSTLKEWYDNKADFAGATLVPVTAGQDTGPINVSLVAQKTPVLAPIYLLLLGN